LLKECVNIYLLAKYLLDKTFGQGTFAALNMDNPNPRVRAVLDHTDEEDSTEIKPPE
jgi:hypothetical protein